VIADIEPLRSAHEDPPLAAERLGDLGRVH
jgi:hypothetical protein